MQDLSCHESKAWKRMNEALLAINRFCDANGVGDMEKEEAYRRALIEAYKRGRKDERDGRPENRSARKPAARRSRRDRNGRLAE